LKKIIHIALLFISIFILNTAKANEKFVKIKGIVTYNNLPINNFSVKLNFDNIDSNTTVFEKEKFELWLPANRKAKVSFIKAGFVTIHMIVDASFIPSFAYKKKQIIELDVKMFKKNEFKKIYLKPFCIADFKASEIKFILTYPETKKSKTIKKFRPPFPTPYSTFKGARPMNKYLKTIETINNSHTNKNHPFFKLTQGIVYSNLNYTIYNERISTANKHLEQLIDIEKNEWNNVKPFDTPEYGAIVLKTLNTEKTRDTLFALGSWIGTSQLLFQSFTSNSKIIIHGKKLSYVLKYYKEFELTEEQKIIVESLRNLSILYDELVKKYMTAMKNKSPLKLIEDELFLQIKSENLSIYNSIIQ